MWEEHVKRNRKTMISVVIFVGAFFVIKYGLKLLGLISFKPVADVSNSFFDWLDTPVGQIKTGSLLAAILLIILLTRSSHRD